MPALMAAAVGFAAKGQMGLKHHIGLVVSWKFGSFTSLIRGTQFLRVAP